MGIAIAFAFSALVSLVALVTRPIIVLYVLLFIFVFFEEFGSGFTSMSGSIFFNQEFLNLYKLKFIEILIAASYTVVLITNKRAVAGAYLGFEKRLGYAFTGLVVCLCFIEYFLHGAVTVSDWRFMVSGFMLFHMLYILLDSEEKFLFFVKIFLVMLGIRALIGLGFLFAGHGVVSPRGVVPFFWDSRQVDAFTFGALVLTGYLAQYNAIAKNGRILSKPFAALLLIILAVTVLLSLRRTLWIIMIIGMISVLYASRRVKLPHLAAFAFIAIVGMVSVLSLPAFEGMRSKVAYYVGTMDVFSEDSDRENEEIRSNEAHIDNIIQYSRIIAENPEILYLGFRGRPGEGYNQFKASIDSEGPLGTAHNGILRTIQGFGVAGLVLYLALYIRPMFRYKNITSLRDSSPVKYIGMSALIFLSLEFVATLLFVPPFYGAMKGIFYTFLPLFLLRAAFYYSSDTSRVVERKKPRAIFVQPKANTASRQWRNP